MSSHGSDLARIVDALTAGGWRVEPDLLCCMTCATYEVEHLGDDGVTDPGRVVFWPGSDHENAFVAEVLVGELPLRTLGREGRHAVATLVRGAGFDVVEPLSPALPAVVVPVSYDGSRWWEPDHPQVLVSVGEQVAAIDVEIAPLVERLWHMGIATDHSCQGDGDDGLVVVGFSRAADADRFLSLAHSAPTPYRTSLEQPVQRGEWSLLVSFAELRGDDITWPDAWTPGSGFAASLLVEPVPGKVFDLPVNVYFPRGELASVLASLPAAEVSV